ncbi:unnamed protein product [Heterobilharzia americana]|nr:unnamed protein product [Heterobilharzia americana]
MLTPHHYCRRCGRKRRYLAGDWKKGYLVKLPKKGDLSVCKNWRGITLLSTQSKQNTRPHHPREAEGCTGFKTTPRTGRQTGFSKYKSYADQIASLHYASS